MKSASGNNFKVTYLCEQPFWNLPRKDGQTWCKSCKKNIPDLRGADRKTVDAMLKRDGGETCGIFYPDQFEINAETRKSPTVLRLVLASAITIFSAGKISSQSIIEPAKTEQHDTSQTSQTSVAEPVRSNPTPDQTADEDKPMDAVRSFFSRRLVLFTIGRREFYVNWKMPFIHTQKARFMGKFKW